MARTSNNRGKFLQTQGLNAPSSQVPFLRESKFKHTFEAEVEKIFPDPHQSRKIFLEEDIVNLSNSINERGLLQPILVRSDHAHSGQWIIVAGERRWRAIKHLGWSHIAAIEYEGDHATANLVENLLRSDLTAVEEAQGLRNLMTHKGWSQSELARQLSLSQPRVNRFLRILDLPESFLKLAQEKNIPANTLLAIARENDENKRQILMDTALAGELTVAEALSSRQRKNSLPKEPISGSSGINEKAIKTTQIFLKTLHKLEPSKASLSQDQKDILRRARSAIDQLLSES
ncbi:MAG: ParB/RepB/Spo0J family partition protein [Acetobacter syzygii]|uniref:ParB/RepB/Spo0J family partition protein n=1 Tax=Acetobacter syzygii TaxID=146476 RepID=UPI0039EB02AB